MPSGDIRTSVLRLCAPLKHACFRGLHEQGSLLAVLRKADETNEIEEQKTYNSRPTDKEPLGEDVSCQMNAVWHWSKCIHFKYYV